MNQSNKFFAGLRYFSMWPLRWIDARYHHVLFRICKQYQYDSFNLYCIDPEEAAKFFEMTIQTLELLKKKDFRRYIRVKKYLPNIAYVKQGIDFYNYSAKAFYVDEFNPDPFGFASSIVHEMTHAYLMSKGFKYKIDPSRHERICVQEQLRFARRIIHLRENLSDCQKKEWIEEWEKWSEECFKTKWWEEKQQRQQRIKRLKILFKN